MKKKRKYRVLGVCGGQGALLFPFRKNLIGNIEPRAVFHTPKEEQWNLNFPKVPFVRSLEELRWDSADIIIGSPNCGHSSVMSYSRKKTLGNPKEDKSMEIFIKAILKYNPKMFLMENLPRLLDSIGPQDWEKMFPDYNFIYHCHSVSEFGNCQISRKRLIIIGIKKATSREFQDLFRVVYPVKSLKSTRDALEYSRRGGNINYVEPIDKKLAMYDYRDPEKKTLTIEAIQKLWTGDFKDEYKWPIKSAKMSTLPGVYRNREDKAPLTLRPSNRQFGPDGYPLGLNDFKVIMGFPNKFKVYMDTANLTYWMNKGRITLSKGSVGEVGLWFRARIKQGLSIYPSGLKI